MADIRASDDGLEVDEGYVEVLERLREVLRRSGSRVHSSIAEALACGVEQQRRTEASAVTVACSEMGADGMPRERDLTVAEQTELERLRGGG